jgi:hypothetical protein
MNLKARRLTGLSFGVLLVLGMVAGCAPEALPPTQHAAISPDQVTIYTRRPSRYEAMPVITVPVTSEMKWDDKGESNAAFDALKGKAAAMGANGVLLEPEKGMYDVLVTVAYRGTWYKIPAKRDPKEVVGRAIWVQPE